jgi:hypothetical protein
MRRGIDKIGNQLKHELFKDDVFRHRMPQTTERPASDFAYSDTVHGTRVVRYDENGRKINETQNA